MASEHHTVGVDVGGTFTDLLAVTADGDAVVEKVLTTPADPSEGVQRVLEASHLEMVDHFVHGSTTAVNAILERDGARTALLSTAGFSDVLEIGRLMKPKLYSLDWDQPTPLVPRRRRRGITERIDATGSVVTPLDETSARETVRELREAGVDAYAVCFLFSFVNDTHERRMKELIEAEHPAADVAISAETLPEIREFQRTSTVAANAYLLPVMDRYFGRLIDRLDDLPIDIERAPMIMRSNGGMMDVETARRNPIETFDSGPAGGVTAAANLGRQLGESNVIAFDMGGTSCEVGIVADGTPNINLEAEVEFEMPIKIPVVDVESIGAGGGSIAWVDDTGVLKVGPESAGADPGPVCYGRGGTEPTITDANMVLGRLNQEGLLGGDLPVDVDAAVDALEGLAGQLGMGLEETCQGVMRISLSNMAMLARKMTVERGHDPRDFVLVAYGGAGPMVASHIAEEIGVDTVVVPPDPGVFSAYGCLSADRRHDAARSYLVELEAVNVGDIASEFDILEDEATENLAGEPLVEYSLDLRYVGEAYELTTPLAGTTVDAAALDAVADRFHGLHEERYAHKRPDDPIEVVSLRVTATEPVETPAYAGTTTDETPRRAAERECYFEAEGFVETPVYNRAGIADTGTMEGPAVIEERTSTTVVPPDHRVRIDDDQNIVIDTGVGR